MKGIVFVHFIEMLEKKYGLEMEDRILETSRLASGGVYTTVGTYDHSELLELVKRLSAETGETVPVLLTDFGHYLFIKLVESYGHLLNNIPDVFSLLAQVENFIHVEVRKLYPDAELPTFEHRFVGNRRLELVYRSSRPFAHLARGLIEGAIAYFDEPVHLERMEPAAGAADQVRFVLVR